MTNGVAWCPVTHKIKKNRKDLYKKEKWLKSNNESIRRKHAKKLKEAKKYLKELQEKIKINYYKPIKTKGAFNDNSIEYESKGDKNKNLSPEDYLDIIRPFLRDIINNHKTHGEWEIQLTIQITFISSLDTGEFRTMHSKSNHVEIMMGIKTDDIIKELFESF